MRKSKTAERKYQREYRRRWRRIPRNRRRELKQRRDVYAASPAQRIAHTLRENKRRKKIRQRHIGKRKRCDICRRVRSLVIDHDHAFAKRNCSHHPKNAHCPRCRRGALCHGCNMALGQFKDNLASATKYLNKWRTQ